MQKLIMKWSNVIKKNPPESLFLKTFEIKIKNEIIKCST